MTGIRRWGVTLIELLVVLAIVAVLMGLLFPAFARAREKGRQAQCLSAHKQFAAGAEIYSQEHYGVYPPAGAFWDEVAQNSRLLKCPNAASLANGYVCNHAVVGKQPTALGGIPETRIWLTADGEHAAGAGTHDNVGYSKDDIDFTRHQHCALASFLDGHVARFTAEAAEGSLFSGGG